MSLDYDKIRSEMSKFLKSEEGKKVMDNFLNKIEIEYEIRNKQLERFNRIGNFNEFVEKVIVKYNSNKYRNFWYNKGIEPPEKLYWFLFDYAEKYGRTCTEDEYSKYGNVFTGEMFYYRGYYFNKMHGQGSVVQIIKK